MYYFLCFTCSNIRRPLLSGFRVGLGTFDLCRHGHGSRHARSMVSTKSKNTKWIWSYKDIMDWRMRLGVHWAGYVAQGTHLSSCLMNLALNCGARCPLVRDRIASTRPHFWRRHTLWSQVHVGLAIHEIWVHVDMGTVEF